MMRETSPYFMGEVSTDDTIGREKSIVRLSGVSEVTRSERHQRNLGDPSSRLGVKVQQEARLIRKRNNIDERGSRTRSYY